MAKKKSSKANRKHEFKYAAPSATVIAPSAKITPGAPAATASTTTQRDFSYVAHDLRRVVMLGGILIILQFVLWYLFNHTGLGPSVYNLVKL